MEGRCHCGAVQVTAPDDAAGVIACHCEDCQRLHGNFFALLAAPASAVRWSGEDHVRWYDSSPSARRAFCDRCGSRLAKQANGSDRVLLSAGLFGPLTGRTIVRHLYKDSHPAWYTVEGA
jgi:hypothetical protein